MHGPGKRVFLGVGLLCVALACAACSSPSHPPKNGADAGHDVASSAGSGGHGDAGSGGSTSGGGSGGHGGAAGETDGGTDRGGAAGAPPPRDGGTAQTAAHTYGTDTTGFDNPERGWYTRKSLVADRDFAAAARLVHSYVQLDAYKAGGDIGAGDALVLGLQAGLTRIREQGRKAILRFAYNSGDWTGTGCSNADATVATIQKHLTQLRPLVQPYRDVAMSFEAGFIGCWGEWHSSWYQGDQDIAPKTNVVQSLVDAFTWAHDATLDADPAWRELSFAPQIAIRYPSLIRAVDAQLAPAAQARVGNHQDCFLASDPDDFGTWGRGPSPLGVVEEKMSVGVLGRDRVVGGETCAFPGRVSCATALAELAAMHFSYLNRDFEPGVIQSFKDGGCYDEIGRRLGYRLWVKAAEFPNSAAAGDSFTLRLAVQNDGFAAPLYDRPVYVVFDGGPGAPARIALLGVSPRQWQPGLSAVSASITIPSDLPAARYRFGLWLPDKAAALQPRPEYAVRLANANTAGDPSSWDAATGLNVLGTGVVITR